MQVAIGDIDERGCKCGIEVGRQRRTGTIERRDGFVREIITNIYSGRARVVVLDRIGIASGQIQGVVIDLCRRCGFQ